MTGRPAEFIGVRTKDLRIKYRFGTHRRGFYARWRPKLRKWECQLSGANMQPHRWFSPSQTMALAHLRLIESIARWQAIRIDKADLWDGIYDTGFIILGREFQRDLFPAELREHLATSESYRGVGHSPTANAVASSSANAFPAPDLIPVAA